LSVLFKLRYLVKKHYRRLTKYAIVGTGGFFVDASFLYVFTQFFRIWYIESEMFATLIAFVTNYAGNTLWTYRDAMKKLEAARQSTGIVASIVKRVDRENERGAEDI
jgi:putative flippase GtrA